MQELLSQLIPSQWGPVHLFDLCLWFGLSDTALALVLHGVEGCKLEDHHLGALPDARDAPHHLYSYSPFQCVCKGWETCSGCCFGFSLDNGIWMKDWDANLKPAAAAAKKAAQTPLVSGILQIFSNDEVLPLAMSNEAAARLLDIAILCGNSKAAANLAKTFSVRPLRRWKGNELLPRDDLPVLSAALLVGADFQDLRVLHVDLDVVEVPLLLQAALNFTSEDWQQLGHLFSSKPRWPSCDVQLVHRFLSLEICEDDRGYFWISGDKVLNASRSGWDLKYIWNEICEEYHESAAGAIYDAGLLDLAILCGNSDCADVLAATGVELDEKCSELLKRACRREGVGLCDIDACRFHVGSASDCKSAASAAAFASLRRSFSREGAETGVAVYQVLNQKVHPKGVPLALVHDILAFSMDAPKILDDLDLWDEVRGWMLPLEVKAGGAHRGLEKDLDMEEEPTSDVEEEPGTLRLCHRTSFWSYFSIPYGVWECGAVV